MNFTVTNDFTYYIYGRPVDTDYDADISIDWNFDVEARSYGIKDIYIDIISVSIELTDSETYEPVKVDFSDFDIVNELEIESNQVMISNVDIDLEEKTIEVS